MHKIFIALALAVLAAGPTAASEKTDVMVPVHQFVDGFNKGDTKTAAAACADQTSIIDEFPPHEWHGAGACSKWMNDYDADAKKNGITDGIVTLSNPRHIDITADRAYVVVPANYTFKKKGKLVTPDNKHQFAIWIALADQSVPTRCLNVIGLRVARKSEKRVGEHGSLGMQIGQRNEE